MARLLLPYKEKKEIIAEKRTPFLHRLNFPSNPLNVESFLIKLRLLLDTFDAKKVKIRTGIIRRAAGLTALVLFYS